ncbi:ATP-binding cassette sub-family A member 1-like isoform X1 [Arapaima gigas]
MTGGCRGHAPPPPTSPLISLIVLRCDQFNNCRFLHPHVRLVIELIWPLFLFFILVWVRSTNPPIYQEQCHYRNKAMPSAGVLPWLQGMMCNIENPCVNSPTPGETPGQVNNFNSSLTSGLLQELQSLIMDMSVLHKYQRLSEDLRQWLWLLHSAGPQNGQSAPLRSLLKDNETFTAYLTRTLSVPASAADTVMSTRIHLKKVTALSAAADLNSIVCNETAIEEYFGFGSPSARETFQNVSCSLSPLQLREARAVVQQNLDKQKLLLPGLDPGLLDRTAQAVGALTAEVSRLQRSPLVAAASALHLRNDTLGALSLLLCGTEAGINSSRPSPAARSNSTGSSETLVNPSDPNTSFCQVLDAYLQNVPALRYVWKTFRPLLRGKVLYTPDTPATRLLIKEANATFQALGLFGELLPMWEKQSPRLWGLLQDGRHAAALQALLRNPTFTAALNQQLNATKLTAEALADFLYSGPTEERPQGAPAYDWQNTLNNTGSVLQTLAQFVGNPALHPYPDPSLTAFRYRTTVTGRGVEIGGRAELTG